MSQRAWEPSEGRAHPLPRAVCSSLPEAHIRHRVAHAACRPRSLHPVSHQVLMNLLANTPQASPFAPQALSHLGFGTSSSCLGSQHPAPSRYGQKGGWFAKRCPGVDTVGPLCLGLPQGTEVIVTLLKAGGPTPSSFWGPHRTPRLPEFAS